jgi:hypothetical protein
MAEFVKNGPSEFSASWLEAFYGALTGCASMLELWATHTDDFCDDSCGDCGSYSEEMIKGLPATLSLMYSQVKRDVEEADKLREKPTKSETQLVMKQLESATDFICVAQYYIDTYYSAESSSQGGVQQERVAKLEDILNTMTQSVMDLTDVVNGLQYGKKEKGKVEEFSCLGFMWRQAVEVVKGGKSKKAKGN